MDEELEVWDSKVFKSNTSSQITVKMHIKGLYGISDGDIIRVRFVKIIKKGESTEEKVEKEIKKMIG